MTKIVVDTGPIVAFLNSRDSYHDWAQQLFESLEPPLYSCESVISEATFLLGNLRGGSKAVLELLSRKLIVLDFNLSSEHQSVQKLMVKYSNIPMSLADACLVRMSELEKESQIITLDQDFNVYRRLGRQIIPVVMP